MSEMIRGPIKHIAVTPQTETFKPYLHQEKAMSQMTKHFLEKKRAAGIVVIPTGGGKTTLASRWLLQNCIAKGQRVLWLAHRSNLLAQAFNDFAKHAHLAAPLKKLSMITVAGGARRWSEVDKSYQVVFSTMQTTGRKGNISFAEQMAADAPNGLIVVIDEAHHAAAPSYWRIAQCLKPLNVQFLGLTATPVRTQAVDDIRLWQVFDASVIYHINIKDLIEIGILAEPRTHTIKTNINFERTFTQEDHDHLKRFGELSAQVLENVANSSPRNQLIVKHYIENKDKYGKTIVFATDTKHARTLKLEFTKQGIVADYIDYTRGAENETIMQSFRAKSIPTVLINVEMLTEGFDAPDIKTVLIARPSGSESLVAQMVGRALRGPKANGTAEAHLVTFVDTWERFHPLTADYAINRDDVKLDDPLSVPRGKSKIQIISNELIEAAYNLVLSASKGAFDSIFSCIPHGWFVWEEEFEDEIVRRTVMIFDNQVHGFEALQNDLERLPLVIDEDDAIELCDRYFGNCPDPRPRLSEIRDLVNALQRTRLPELNDADDAVKDSEVQRYTFEEKHAVALDLLAKKFLADEVPRAHENKYFKDLFDRNDVLQIIYRKDMDSFKKELRTAIDAQLDASDKIAETPPEILETINQTPEVLSPWPQGQSGYSLNQIWDAICQPKAHFKGNPPTISDRQWVQSNTAWGFYRYSDRFVGLNKILNSPDIPLFVVEFVCYHEALHADMPNSAHNNEFRERERRFIPSAAALEDAQTRGISPGTNKDAWRTRADQFLDTFRNRFAWAPAKGEM